MIEFVSGSNNPELASKPNSNPVLQSRMRVNESEIRLVGHVEEMRQ
jgi:hypothetical protein